MNKTQQKIIKKGYKVQFIISKGKGDEGYIIASKVGRTVSGKSLTDTLKKIQAY